MELWIARDKNKRLWMYNETPIRKEQEWGVGICGYYMPLDSNLFPEVTWENSPRKVKIELV